MSSVLENRTYAKDKDEYGAKVRTMLGLEQSAVVLADDGKFYGYAGETVDVNLVDPSTGRDGLNQPYTLPTDFRAVGIAVMTQLGIPAEIQITMFTNFMTNYTKEQRSSFIAQYDALDKNDADAVQNFVNEMISILAH